MLRALVLTLLLASTASAYKSPSREPRDVDLIVGATLIDLRTGRVRAHGGDYDEVRATLAVHDLVFAEAGAAAPGETVELYFAQYVGAGCPRLSPPDELGQRGLWLLDRSDVDGVYTAYFMAPCRPRELVKPASPSAWIVGGSWDPRTGAARARVRYRNLGPDPVELDEVSFDAEGRPRGLGRELHAGGTRLTPSPEPATARVAVPPWSWVERWTTFAAAPDQRLHGSLFVASPRQACELEAPCAWLPSILGPDPPRELPKGSPPRQPFWLGVGEATSATPHVAPAPVSQPWPYLVALALASPLAAFVVGHEGQRLRARRAQKAAA